jgi:hypothetical protein
MDVNHYVVGVFASQRLDELRAQAERYRVARSLRAPGQPLRAIVGGWLIALGRLVLGEQRAEPRQEMSVGRPV